MTRLYFPIALVVFSIFVNCWTLKDGHNWGDDFAQYIINARNIIESKPYASGIMLDNTVICPPGLPLLLAPVLKVFGLNFKILKLINIFFWYLSIFFLYGLFLRKEGRNFALMTAVFLALSSFFFFYKQNVLSDIPFFLFVCSSLYNFQRWEACSSIRQGRLFLIGFICSMSAALWVRSAGAVLFVSSLFYFIFIKRDSKALAAVLTVFLINEVLLFSWMGWHPGSFVEMWQMPYAFMMSVVHNFTTVFESLWCFFCPSQTIYSHVLFNMVDPAVCLAAPVLYLMMIWSFIRLWKNKKLSYLECFSFFYMSLLIIWSGIPTPPDAFTRYILPLLPFAFTGGWRLLVFLKRFKIDSHGWARMIFLVLLLLNLTNVIYNWNFNDDVLDLPANRELVAWIKQNMKPNEHFMFWKPRALALMTGRVGMPPWISPDQEPYFLARVKDFKISYVFSFKNDQSFITQLEESKQFRTVWENGAYKVFKFTD